MLSLATWRVVALCFGVLACLVSGSLYGFGVWAPIMRDVFSQGEHPWLQSDINLVGNVGDVGLYLGLTAGIFLDRTGKPWLTMLLGGFLQGLGYLMMGLATLKYFYCPWALMAFFFFLTGQGSFATFTAGYLPSLFNHHGKWRSRIMGVMVGAFAASSMIFAVIFRYRFRVSSGNVALEQHNLAMYLFVLGGVTSGVAFLCAFFVPMVGPAPQVLEEEPLQEDVTRDVSPLRLFTLLNFYLVFGAMFFVTGPGLLWITVQGSLAKSLHLESAVDILVLLLGAGSVIGRIGIGFISDLTARKISRAYYFIPAGVIMSLTHLFFAFFQNGVTLYLAALFTGVAYGTAFTVGTTLMSALFGKRYAGTNIGILSLGPAIAGIAMGQISGALVDAQANAPGGHCFGAHCYRSSFIISGSISMLTVVFSILAGRRTPPTGRAGLAPTEAAKLINDAQIPTGTIHDVSVSDSDQE